MIICLLSSRQSLWQQCLLERSGWLSSQHKNRLSSNLQSVDVFCSQTVLFNGDIAWLDGDMSRGCCRLRLEPTVTMSSYSKSLRGQAVVELQSLTTAIMLSQTCIGCGCLGATTRYKTTETSLRSYSVVVHSNNRPGKYVWTVKYLTSYTIELWCIGLAYVGPTGLWAETISCSVNKLSPVASSLINGFLKLLHLFLFFS